VRAIWKATKASAMLPTSNLVPSALTARKKYPPASTPPTMPIIRRRASVQLHCRQ
jgi:hypothetical protein